MPGMELLGVGPNWLLIWVVAWSVKRTAFQGAIAGIALGLVQDGMTAYHPTHALSLAVVGILTARIQKQRYIQEDFVSVALIVFGMAVLAETITALQFSLPSFGIVSNPAQRTLPEIWFYHQRIALSSAILSSLWAPAVYYPLNRWWEKINDVEQTSI
jgi:rod shape-determining protein MreD